MGYYADLREFLQELERRGKLVRWQRAVDKDSELMPLFRLQFRGLPEEERKVFLFENVVNAKGQKYNMRVAPGCSGATREIVALALGCERPDEIYEKWRYVLTHPIEPVIVETGPVQEEVHTGAELQQLGLDELPAPVEEPGFSGVIRTTSPWITKDPEAGVRNVGMYSGHFRARDRIQCGVNPVSQAMLYHWKTARRLRQPLPVAITVGATPDLAILSAAKLPYGLDELAVAGAIEGRPLELVRCKTVPLEVPANAEIVIEGEISTEVREPYAAFGEYPGYLMGENWSTPVLKVTAITHRRNAIFTPILVGMPPSDSGLIGQACLEMALYSFLKYDCNLPEVQEVCYSPMGHNYLVIRMKKVYPSQPWQALNAAASIDPSCKMLIAVDDDINPRDPDMVNWALSYSMQPYEDAQIIRGRVARLDPSGAVPSRPGDPQESFPGQTGASSLLINATRKRPYPPVGLPGREFMERALLIWRDEELPELKLRPPWYGYSLGRWGADQEENARWMVQGEYLKVGEKLAKRQTPVVDESSST